MKDFLIPVEHHDNQAGEFLFQLELNAFALHLCLLADTFLITFSETLLEGLSNGPKDMEKEDDKKTREPSKNMEEMTRDRAECGERVKEGAAASEQKRELIEKKNEA